MSRGPHYHFHTLLPYAIGSFVFKEYDMVDEYPAPQELYSHYCRKCWPLATPPVPEESDGCSVSSASSSSSGA